MSNYYEPYVRPEFEEFSGSVTMRLVYDAIGEALQEIDRQLEAVGPVAFEIALASRGYVKERACEIAGVYTYGERDELRAYALSCGHEFDWDHADPPAYCPCCGAKVVSQ